MDEWFGKQQPILITDVQVDGKAADIFINSAGRLAGIGEGVSGEYRGMAELTIDGAGAIALPGLVNAHTHAAMTLLRGYADDMPLDAWLSEKIWPLEAHLTGDDVYWGTKLACLEMIRTGTTAFNDMYFFMDRAAQAVDEAGIRAVLSYGFIDNGDPGKREGECRATEALVSRIRAMDNPRIMAAVGPHAIYTVSPEGLRWCADYAAEQEIGIHIHLSETKQEVDDCLAQHGMRPAAYLDSCGILTPRTVAAHGCWLSGPECRLLGKRRVSVAHNPSSNMKLATNRALPCHLLERAGANVCLGTDGCASNNSLDMLHELKTAALLQKFFWNDPTLLPAPAALGMATANGAGALGIPAGALRPGAPADLILVAARASCNTPLHNAASNLVYSCSGGAVTTTICNGRILMLDGIIPGREEILAGAAAAAAGLVSRAEQSS